MRNILSSQKLFNLILFNAVTIKKKKINPLDGIPPCFWWCCWPVVLLLLLLLLLVVLVVVSLSRFSGLLSLLLLLIMLEVAVQALQQEAGILTTVFLQYEIVFYVLERFILLWVMVHCTYLH